MQLECPKNVWTVNYYGFFELSKKGKTGSSRVKFFNENKSIISFNIMENYLKYKKYLGSVDFSAEENSLYGKILGINDLISYEGTSIKTLEDAFKKAVEDYLTTCETLGKLPDK